jgi:hypothetical protein
MADDPIIPPPLAPELIDLLRATERDVLRAIVRDGHVIDGFKARLLNRAHELRDEVGAAAWLLVRRAPAMLDTLAAFEADEADLEAEPDLEEGGDLEPSLGATNDKNQEKAWRSPTYDLEYDGDGVADPDLEDDDPGGGNMEDEPQGDSAQQNGHYAGPSIFDDEPSLGATDEIDQTIGWSRRQTSSPTRKPKERSTISCRRSGRSSKKTRIAPRSRKPWGD